MNFRLALLFWLLNYASAQDRNCDFTQNITVGQTFYVSSPNYPMNYTPGVMCRWIATSSPGYNSRVDCSEMSLPQMRIVGGQETYINEFKMMAGLVERGIAQIKCGAVIISNQHVLTAAHCVNTVSTRDLLVVVGEHDVTTGDSPYTKVYQVDSITIHPQFNSNTYANDIAIVKTNTPINFNTVIGPACLPFKFAADNLAGRNVTMLGWGSLSPRGPTSDVLRKVDVEVISESTCRAQNSSVTSRQMCTFAQGKDACQNDSGGPLLYIDPVSGLLFIVGIISHGSCASGEPGINTRITSYLEWIVENTSYDYCVIQ